jgi:hypothetical protein
MNMLAIKYKKVLYFLTVFGLSACSNESGYIGKYYTHECRYLKGDSCLQDAGYIDLQDHHKFELTILSKSLKGSWRHYDNNDASIIELSSDGFNHSFQCVVGKEGRNTYCLDIVNPHILLGIDTLKSLRLKISR